MPRQPVTIVVNADDLGKHVAVNEGIAAGLRAKTVTSSTVMANGPAFGDALRVIRSHSSASFGVHLNLTEFTPLTKGTGLACILNERGTFDRQRLETTAWSPAFHRSVVAEWCAQVARIQAAGVAVSHLDSHQHVHTLPQLFLPFKDVQRRCGLRRARGTWSIFDRAHAIPTSLRLKKAVWTWALTTVYRSRTPAAFSDFAMFLHAVAEGSFRPRQWPASIELMVHPDARCSTDQGGLQLLVPGWQAALPIATQTATYRDI